MNLDFSFNAELLIIHLVVYPFIIFIFLKIRRKIIDKRTAKNFLTAAWSKIKLENSTGRADETCPYNKNNMARFFRCKI